MNDSIRLTGKKALAIAVAATTILWAVGISAFIAPLTADAASPGSLVKGSTLSTVYYYAADGSRYSFPNEKTYFTWYSDFSSVQQISDSELAAIPLAGNIVYRPGSRFIKIQSDPKTYAVGPNGTVRWIESEAVASGLNGAAWNQFIDDVPDVFFVDYTVGPSLTSASAGYNGMLVNGTYLISNGQKRMVTNAGFAANRYQSRFVAPGAGVDLGAMSAGSDVSGVEGPLANPTQTGTVTTGGLNVSLASDTPASATLPGMAASVPFTKVKLQAQSGSASVDALTFKLGGVGAVTNIDKAYVYEGSTRLTKGKNINSASREAAFSALGLNLGNGGMTYVTVRADLADANGGDTANFGLMGPASVSSTASVSGSFPVVGNTMTFSDTDAGTITVDKRGTVTDPTLGQKGATIAKFEIEAMTEDAWLDEITVNVDDAGDHSNYELWKGDQLLAVGVVHGDLVTFVLLNPLFIEEGNKANLDITADIGGDANDPIKVAIEEHADVFARGGDFGFNLEVDIDGYDEDGADCASNADDCSFSTIQGGDLTFAFNGPPSDDVQVDGNDQNMFDFTITSENWVELTNIGVDFSCLTGASAGGCLINTTGAAVANFDDITIRRANGSTFMGPVELATGGSDTLQSLDFNDTQVLQAGTSADLMITTDVANNELGAFVGNEFRFAIDMNGSSTDGIDAEDSNGDNLAAGDIVPSSDLTGNIFTIRNSTLDVVASSPPSSSTWVKGAQNVDVAGFNFSAGNATSVTVTDIKYSATGEDTIAGLVTADDIDVGDHVNSCSLYDAESGAHIDGPEGLDAADEIQFNDFTWTIPAGETKKQKVRCNFANVATESADDDQYAFFIDDADNIDAQDNDGDDVTAVLGEDNDDGAVTTITVTDAGELAFTLDGSSPKAGLILGNSTGVRMSVFKANATNESFLVTDLALDNCILTTADANGDCADGGEALGADDIAAAVRVKYTNQAGEAKTKTGFLSSGTTALNGLTWFVPSSDSRSIEVEIDTNVVSAAAATSGDQMQLNLDIEDSGDAVFKAVGSASGATIDEGDVDTYVVAKAMTIRKTKPTVTLHAASPSGASTPSFQEVLRFNVAADSRGFVDLNAFTMQVSSTDNGGGLWNECQLLADPALWEFYDASDSSEKLDDDDDWFWLEKATDGDAAADDDCTASADVGFAILDLGADATTAVETIGAGQTKTYVVKVDSSLASSDPNDSLRLDIIDETTAEAMVEDCNDDAGATDCDSFDANDSDDGVDAAGEVAAMSWDDDNEATEINGANIKNLPITGGTLVY